MSHVVITGSALATPQGTDARTTWRNLLAGVVLHGTGRVPLEPLSASVLPRVSQLAIHVARSALAEAGWPPGFLADPRTALIIGTSKGPIEAWLNPPLPGDGSPDETRTFGLAAVATDVARAIHHGAGPRMTASAACASGLHALIRAQQLIDSGQCDRAIVVAAESATSALFEAAFKRMGVLARPEIGCRPFDKAREGFLLAEAAAAVCLERSHLPGIAVTHTAMAADAFHLTSPDPAGAALDAVLRQVTAGGAVDIVHAHGTGTLANDLIELTAIDRVASGTGVVSHKHAIGHTQGAAGLIGVVLNVLMHRQGVVFGNANSPNPMQVGKTWVVPASLDRKISTSIVLAAGFGGPIAAVRLESV